MEQQDQQRWEKEMNYASIRMDQKKKHSTCKYENAKAILYLEYLLGANKTEFSVMLYTKNDKETWTFGGDYNPEMREKIKPENYIMIDKWGKRD